MKVVKSCRDIVCVEEPERPYKPFHEAFATVPSGVLIRVHWKDSRNSDLAYKNGIATVLWLLLGHFGREAVVDSKSQRMCTIVVLKNAYLLTGEE